MIYYLVILTSICGQLMMKPLADAELVQTFSGKRFVGYSEAAFPHETFFADGRYSVNARGLTFGRWWVDGAALCVNSGRHAQPECRWFSVDPQGRVYETRVLRDGRYTDRTPPDQIILEPAEP